MDVKILSILVLIFLLFAETDSAAKSSKDKAASRIGRGNPYSFAGPLKTSRSARRQKARKLNRTVGEKHAQGAFFSGDYGHANLFSKPIPEYFQFNANRDVKIHGNGQIIMEDVTENGQEKKSKPDGHTDLQTGTAETQMEIPESKGETSKQLEKHEDQKFVIDEEHTKLFKNMPLHPKRHHHQYDETEGNHLGNRRAFSAPHFHKHEDNKEQRSSSWKRPLKKDYGSEDENAPKKHEETEENLNHTKAKEHNERHRNSQNQYVQTPNVLVVNEGEFVDKNVGMEKKNSEVSMPNPVVQEEFDELSKNGQNNMPSMTAEFLNGEQKKDIESHIEMPVPNQQHKEESSSKDPSEMVDGQITMPNNEEYADVKPPITNELENDRIPSQMNGTNLDDQPSQIDGMPNNEEKPLEDVGPLVNGENVGNSFAGETLLETLSNKEHPNGEEGKRTNTGERSINNGDITKISTDQARGVNAEPKIESPDLDFHHKVVGKMPEGEQQNEVAEPLVETSSNAGKTTHHHQNKETDGLKEENQNLESENPSNPEESSKDEEGIIVTQTHLIEKIPSVGNAEKSDQSPAKLLDCNMTDSKPKLVCSLSENELKAFFSRKYNQRQRKSMIEVARKCTHLVLDVSHLVTNNILSDEDGLKTVETVKTALLKFTNWLIGKEHREKRPLILAGMNFSKNTAAALNAIISAAGRISDPNEDNDRIINNRIKFINNFINLQWGKGQEDLFDGFMLDFSGGFQHLGQNYANLLSDFRLKLLTKKNSKGRKILAVGLDKGSEMLPKIVKEKDFAENLKYADLIVTTQDSDGEFRLAEWLIGGKFFADDRVVKKGKACQKIVGGLTNAFHDEKQMDYAKRHFSGIQLPLLNNENAAEKNKSNIELAHAKLFKKV